MLEKYNNWIDVNESRINTYANHLIVIFAFSVPLLVSVRRVSIVLIILLFIVRGKIFRRTINVLSDPVLMSMALYFLVHVLWLIGSDNFLIAKKSVHDASFLLFVPLFVSFIDEKYVKRITNAFIFGMSISVIISYGLFFKLIPPMIHDGSQGGSCDPTPLWHHSHYGYMLAITSILLLYQFIHIKEDNLKRFGILILFSAMIFNMFIIEGRTGYILFVLLLFVMVIFEFGRKSIFPLVISTLLIMAASFLAYNYINVFKSRVDLTVSSLKSVISKENYNTSIGARIGMDVYALKVIAKKPVFGNGTGGGISEVRKIVEKQNRPLSRMIETLHHAHNEYISALLQFGIIGLLFFLNIPYQMLKYSSVKNRMLMKLLGISVLFYSLIDVFIIGLGMLLTVVTLTSVSVSHYSVNNAVFNELNKRQLANYSAIILFFYLFKKYSGI